jgi:hypothetical protein
MSSLDQSQISQSLTNLIEFIGQEAEWKCWQTGIELKYLDYTLIRIKELVQDPLSDLKNENDQSKQNNDIYSLNSLLYRDCENEFKSKSYIKNKNGFVC